MKKVITLFSLLLMAAVQTWAVPANPIAQITVGENTKYCYNLADFIEAFESIEGTATVQLLDDLTLPNGQLISNAKKGADITLDLNEHNIQGDVDNHVIVADYSTLTIEGNGVVENKSGGVITGFSQFIINNGTYKSISPICHASVNYENILTNKPIINGGKFNATELYFYDEDFIDEKFATMPIVKGGLFSMDPSDCVAEGYEVVENEDEDTKGEYPYKVVFSPYNYLASLIGDKAYSYGPFKVYVDKGSIICDAMGDTNPYTVENLSISGNEYYLKDPGMKFVVEDGSIAHVYAISSINNEIICELMESASDLESELVALIGDNVYYNDAMDLRLYVDNDMVVVMGIPICQMGHLTMSDGNYICELSGYTTFVFVVEDSEIARVNMSSYEGETTFSKEVIPDGPLAGLLSVPQAGKLDIQAYFTASIGRPYQYMLVKGAYYSLEALKEDINKSIYVYESGKLTVESAPQSISIVKDDEELEDGEDYTLVVYYTSIDDEINELATIPFTVGVGEKESDDIMTISAGKLNITYSFSVSDEKFEEGMNYMYMLIEGEYYSMEQAQNSRKNPIYASFGSKQLITPDDEITMTSNPEEISLVSDDVELKDGKVYTLIVYNVFTSEGPKCYAMAHYKAVDNSTPTAIESLDANKSQKAVKTIENGKVVIIKNGEKFDLAGRKL